jgi:hypothetical protein
MVSTRYVQSTQRFTQQREVHHGNKGKELLRTSNPLLIQATTIFLHLLEMDALFALAARLKIKRERVREDRSEEVKASHARRREKERERERLDVPHHLVNPPPAGAFTHAQKNSPYLIKVCDSSRKGWIVLSDEGIDMDLTRSIVQYRGKKRRMWALAVEANFLL